MFRFFQDFGLGSMVDVHDGNDEFQARFFAFFNPIKASDNFMVPFGG